MREQVLKDSSIFPSDAVLLQALGESSFNLFKSFREVVTGEEYSLVPEWRFFNDGKEWLCKMTYKKKTTLWLSASKGYFCISFHFAERHLEKIATLAISETIKQEFALVKPAGRLVSMIINVYNEEQVADILTIIRFKKKLK